VDPRKEEEEEEEEEEDMNDINSVILEMNDRIFSWLHKFAAMESIFVSTLSN
jgi:hypothetical protein